MTGSRFQEALVLLFIHRTEILLTSFTERQILLFIPQSAQERAATISIRAGKRLLRKANLFRELSVTPEVLIL